jgi:hypothetical protein
MFNAAWKMLTAAPFVACFHKAGIVLPEDECKNESEGDTSVVQNWRQLCKALGSMFRLHMMTLLVSYCCHCC